MSRYCVSGLRACAGLALIAMLAVGAPPAAARLAGPAGQLPQFLIVDYHPVSKTLVAGSPANKPLYDYAYRVDIRNGGAAVADVSAVVASTSKHFTIVQPDVHFGPVGSRATATSRDSFVVRASCQFDQRLDPQTAGGGSPCKGNPGPDDLAPGIAQGAEKLANVVYTFAFTKLFAWQVQVRVGSAPKVSATLPTGLVNQATPQLGASFEDTGGGVSASSLELAVDGIDVSRQASATATGFTYVPAAALNDGAHQVTLSISDLADHAAQVNWSFVTDTVAPAVSGAAPRDITTADPLVPISAQYSDAGSGVNLAGITLAVDGVDVTANAEKTASAISYKPAGKLANGTHTATLSVADAAGNGTTLTWSFKIDQSGPVATDLQPANNTVLAADATPTIAANFGDGLARLDPAGTGLQVDGVDVEMTMADATVDGRGRYRASATLIDGTNMLVVEASFADGAKRSTSLELTYEAPPKVTITSPADKAMLGRGNATSPGGLTGNVERPVTITGRTSKPVTSVRINQQAATLASDGMQYQFDNFFLYEGSNLLTALASTTDALGHFQFDVAPPGRIDRFIDGRTVNPTNDPAQKQWPSLHFESFAVRGQSNELPHPIYLPPLLVSEAKTVVLRHGGQGQDRRPPTRWSSWARRCRFRESSGRKESTSAGRGNMSLSKREATDEETNRTSASETACRRILHRRARRRRVLCAERAAD